MTNAPDVMSRGERDELGQLSRNYVRVGKQQIKQRSAELLADFEEKLSAEYDPVDIDCAQVMQEVIARFTAAKAEADAAIAAACEARNIPKRFRPSFTYGLQWNSRGENTTATRRTELRNAARTAAAAAEQKAATELEAEGLKREMALTRGQLRSYEARAFLASMPTIEQLMPPLTVTDVRRLAHAHGARTAQEQHAFRALHGYGALPEPPLLDDDDDSEAEG